MAVKHLTKEDFIANIFDFENEKEWKYKGNKPAIIDFYADWCGPCRAVAPTVEQLSVDYEGKVDVYKIDTEKESELSGLFGIQSIPTFLFIPVNNPPMVQRGAISKSVFTEVIENRLLSETAVADVKD